MPHADSKLLARDIMRRDVTTIPEDADLWEIARILTRDGITGAPVVNAHGKPVGVVSQTDIVAHLQRAGLPPCAAVDFYGEPEADGVHSRGRQLTARQIMNPKVIHADEDTTVGELRLMMLRHRIHRVIIVQDKRITGIVTTMDILKAR